MINARLKLGELLVSGGKITRAELENALEIQKKSGKELEDILLDRNYIKDNDIIEVLECQLRIFYVDLYKYKINKNYFNPIYNRKLK